MSGCMNNYINYHNYLPIIMSQPLLTSQLLSDNVGCGLSHTVLGRFRKRITLDHDI